MAKVSSSPSSTGIPKLGEDWASINEPDVVPEGWFTVLEFATANQYSRSHTHRMLKECVKHGTYEEKTFRIRTGRMVRSVPHFRKLQKGR